jgi:hypothetical protein
LPDRLTRVAAAPAAEFEQRVAAVVDGDVAKRSLFAGTAAFADDQNRRGLAPGATRIIAGLGAA